MTALPVPSATAGPERLADFLELQTFKAADRSSSLEDLIAALRRTGTSEELEPLDDDQAVTEDINEKNEACALDAFAELEDRKSACGGNGVYPFQVQDRSIVLVEGAEHSIYAFLLLLSQFGFRAGPKHTKPERLFEDLCRAAAENYFGGPALGGKALHFGFPRRVLPAGFSNALRELMNALDDGRPNDDAPRLADQKDAKLDIVAWKDFPDRRRGKLIAYGQCAVGYTDWKDKVTELQPLVFNKQWLREHPVVDPTKLFFVPFRVETGDWCEIGMKGGILFDRCRVAALAGEPNGGLREECTKWSLHVLAQSLQG